MVWLQDILAYEAGGSLVVEGAELGPGDLRILRDFRAPEGTKPGAPPRCGRAVAALWLHCAVLCCAVLCSAPVVVYCTMPLGAVHAGMPMPWHQAKDAYCAAHAVHARRCWAAYDVGAAPGSNELLVVAGPGSGSNCILPPPPLPLPLLFCLQTRWTPPATARCL